MHKLTSNTNTRLTESFILHYTYHSNAYEGNTLSVEQTEAILNGKNVAGKTVREHLEVLNHAKALAFSFCGAERQEVTEAQLQEIHHLLIEAMGIETGYRKKNSYLPNLRWTPLDYKLVPTATKGFMIWFNDHWKSFDLFTLVDLQVRFLNIAPFVDCNEKLARLLVTVVLWHNHHKGIIFHHDDSKRYYTYMNLAREGKPQHMIDLMEKFTCNMQAHHRSSAWCDR